MSEERTKEQVLKGLTYYDLVADIEKLKNAQERVQVDLMKLGRTYTSLQRDERFQRIEAQVAASLESYEQILKEYNQRNADSEGNND